MLKKCVMMCGEKYNFNVEEAMSMITREMGGSKGGSKGVGSSKKSEMLMPFNGEHDSSKCGGLNKNHGLYTQCSSSRKEGEAYCVKCSKQALKNSHGLPDYGHIDNRVRCYEREEEFVDPSGKKPIAYLKIMNKLKLTEEQVRDEALKQGLKLDPRHFLSKKSGRPAKEKVLKESKAKGRPKKSKKVLELAGEEDLFASLVMTANSSQADKNVDDVIEETVTNEVVADEELPLGDVKLLEKVEQKKAKVPRVPKVKELSEEQKKVEAEQKKAEKEQKKVEAEQKKAEKEQKAALAEQKKAEKEQKAALAEQKKQEKEQKAALAEQKKVTEKKVKNTNIDDDDDRPTPVFVSPPDDTDVVKKIIFEGKKYLKSKNSGIIYNMEQDVVGKWNEEKERIDFDEGEESEDEYDEDE